MMPLAQTLSNGLSNIPNGDKHSSSKLTNNSSNKSIPTNKQNGTSHVMNGPTKPIMKSQQKNGQVEAGDKSSSSLDKQFHAAVDLINGLPKNGPFKPSNEMLLKFYSFFKQATQGPCKSSRPSIFNVVERAKWDAYNSVRHLTKDQAMQGYIEELKSIVETMPHNELTQQFYKVLDPFYEFVENGHDESSSISTTTTTSTSSSSSDSENELEQYNNKKSESTSLITSTESVLLVNGGTSNFKITPPESPTVIEKKNGISPTKKLNGEGVSGGSSNDSLEESIAQATSEALVCINGDLSASMSLLSGVENKIAEIKSKTAATVSQVNGTNTSDLSISDDEEDFCDTSDHINEQDFSPLSEKTAKNNPVLSFVVKQELPRDINYNRLKPASDAAASASNQTQPSANESYDFQPVIHKYGGETNTPSTAGGAFGGSSSYLNQSRQSRPGSSQSISYRGGGLGSGLGGGGGSSGGGGGFPPNDLLQPHYLNSDSTRQILLILLRLQQDTNNVLTRLSYLEATVMSLQNNLQMNRLVENNMHQQQNTSNNNNSNNRSAFSSLSPSSSTRAVSNNRSSSSTSFLLNFLSSVDWKTVIIAVLWPLVIRLVFILFRKIRLFSKLKRLKQV